MRKTCEVGGKLREDRETRRVDGTRWGCTSAGHNRNRGTIETSVEITVSTLFFEIWTSVKITKNSQK